MDEVGGGQRQSDLCVCDSMGEESGRVGGGGCRGSSCKDKNGVVEWNPTGRLSTKGPCMTKIHSSP